jgi:hypothetical protein
MREGGVLAVARSEFRPSEHERTQSGADTLIENGESGVG